MFHLQCRGDIVWGITLVRGVIRSDWGGVLELGERFLDIYWHRDVQYAGLLVPVECYATLLTPCSILYYFIFLLECIYEVLGVLYYLVSDSKFFDHEGKCYSILVVAPQSRHDWRRLISKRADMFLEHCVCNDDRLN